MKGPSITSVVAPNRDYACLVWPLSVAQLISWGTIYYSFTLFLTPMEAELGLTRTELTGALTLGLLLAGVCSFPVGALIDKGHARVVMTGASLLGGLLLLAWSQVQSGPQFYAIWCGLGIVLAATLYEPAFAVLVGALGVLGRRGIAAMTLVGGFASTLFIPLTHLLIEQSNWRTALVALAAFNLAGAAPIHFFALRGETKKSKDIAAGPSTRSIMSGAIRQPAFWLVMVAFTAGFLVISAVTFHVIPMLTEFGFSTGLAVSAVALFGPAQVAGRIFLTFFATSLGLSVSGLLALGLPALGFVLVLSGLGGFATIAIFAVCLGIGNGIMTIVRAEAVAELISRVGFGAINGAINAPITAARALGPSLASAIWAATEGYISVLWSLIGISLFASLAFLAAVKAGPNRVT